MSNDNGERRIAPAQEDPVSAKARETGQNLKELVAAIGRKTKAVAQEKTDQLKAAADDKNIAVKDAVDIQMLGSHIDSIISIFDSTMDSIGQYPYDEQQKMMVGFKKVLQEEIYVINARLNMAKRLKGLEPSANPDALKERTAMNRTDAEIVAPPISEAEEEETLAGLEESERSA